MSEASLPSEFSELYGSIRYIQRKNPFEYSSSCPHCGGSIHSDGELPDRFIMLLSARAKAGIPFGWCRKCGYRWWQGQTDNKPVDPAVIAELERQSKEAEAIRNAERQKKLQEFSTHELWNELHRRLGEEERRWWREAGVPDEWQNYLKLGYTPDKTYSSSHELRHSPAYTIPYFGLGFVFRTMQYRLCSPENPDDRYRFEAGLGTYYYMTTPNQKVKDEVVVCEGAKKAMVLKIWGEEELTVLSVPSKNDWRGCGIIETVKDCGRVYIVFDPDCYDVPPDANSNWKPQPVQFAKELGDIARIVDCPVKIDDAFNHYDMTREEWACLKKQSVKI